MTQTVKVDREQFESLVGALEKTAPLVGKAFRDAVVPEPQVAWGAGYGARRHIIDPEVRIDVSRRHADARTLCGNFVGARAEGRDVTNLPWVMTKQPCQQCLRSAAHQGIAL